MIENVRRLNEENAKLRELLAECKELLASQVNNWEPGDEYSKGRVDACSYILEMVGKRIEEALK